MSVNAKRRNKAWMGILLVVAVLAQIGFIPPRTNVAEAADNGLAQKPYMGWSSYSMQVYDGPSGNWISEDKIKLMSDTMHEKLQAHGYEYINIDAGWNGSMDEYGRPVPSTEKYPNGFENLIDYVHANGQKVGIYMIPGISPDAVERDLPIYGAPGCTIGDIVVRPFKYGDYWNLGYKIDFSNPCAQKWVDSVADLIASWGVDFVKFDSVTPGSGHNDESIDARGDVKAWSEALSKHGIWLELSWALDHNYVDYWKKYANGWRIDWDVEAYDPNIGMTQWANIARLFPGAALWWRDAGPGGWNDFDSLNVGNGETSGLTKDERQTAATLWAASAAQFYTGDDLTKLDDYGLSLYTNDEVIAVNQAGHPIHPVSMDTDQQAWYANNGDGTYTVALFNLGSKGARVGVKWSDIGLNGTGSIRDLWSHKEIGSSATGIDPLFLEPHASRLFKVTVQNGTSIVNDDDTGMKYTGEWTRNGGNELVRDAQDLSVVITDSSGSGGSSGGDSGAGNGNGGDSGAGDGSSGSGDDTSSSYTVTINDDDPAITYANKWGHSTGRSFGDYMGDVHYGEPDGSEPELTYTFEGTGVELLSEQSTSSGKIDIYIDGDFQSTVDSYGSDQVGQHSVFSVADLPQGTHTLKAVRNAGGQYYFLFDALKVTADTLLGSPSATSFNKDAPADITVPLPLGKSSLTGVSNGTAALQQGTDYTVAGGVVTIKSSYLAQQASGQSAALSFQFAGGAAQTLSVAVSGTSISPVSASFDKRPGAQADLAVTLTLGDSNELTDVKNGANALTEGTDYTVDGNVVRIAKSYLASLPVGDASLSFEFSSSSPRMLALTVLNSASPGRYVFVNNDDPGIRYTGSWNRSSGRGLGDYKDDVQWTENNDSFFTYTFQGTGIDYITEVDEGQGNVEIFIDGVSQGHVSTYEAGAHNAPQRTVYTVRGLTNGFHTIKAVKKSGKFMLLDTLRVQLPDLIDVSSTDFAKNAPADVSVNLLASPDSLNGVFNGSATLVRGTDYTIEDHVLTIKQQYLAAQPVGTTKLTLRFRGDYGDDAHASAAEGAAFSYTFKGTGIELLSPVGPKQGEMEVYIDGDLKTTVNAYADSRDSQVSLYSVSGLTAGSHTIRVVKKSGELMLADALRFTTLQASVPPVSGGTVTTPVEPAAPKVVRTTQPDGTVRDELALAGTEAKALIEARKASGASALKLVVPDSKGAAAETGVKLDAEAVKQLAASGLDLDIDVSGAKIHVPNAILKNINTEVHFVISPVTEQKAQLERRANLSTVVSAAVKDSKITLIGYPTDIDTNLPEGETTLVLPLPAGDWSSEALSHIGIYIEHSDGTVEYKQGAVVDIDGGKGIQFKNSKFSAFALVKLGEASGTAPAAYMNGFEGNLFKPEKAITRAEMATILSRIAQDGAEGTEGRVYSDVKQGYWAADAIRKATAAGLMNGYADGTFRPEKAITRAEMAQLAVRLAGGGSKLGTGFADTTGHWAEQAVKAAEGAGYINGYTDGSFRPDRTLSRAEAVVVINRSLGISPSGGGASSWKDVPASYWASSDIEAASIQK